MSETNSGFGTFASVSEDNGATRHQADCPTPIPSRKMVIFLAALGSCT
jgi:hypothetical protein